MKNIKSFLKKAETKVNDLGHRKRLNFNISKYDAAVPLGKLQFENLELAKDRAAYIKRKVVNNLEKYLLEFEINFSKNGGELLWAQDEAEAIEHILNICKQNKVKSVVKSKSMVTEEIHLNSHLEKNGIEPIETDLGEFIVQLIGEPPYHIVTPVMHKSKEDIAAIFNQKFGTPIDYTPEQLTLEARKILRSKFINADAGITGANFLISDIGAVSVTENEGNARMSTALPKIHIVIAGLERLLPSINDLPLFLPLLSTLGTGQTITTYNTMFFGPKKHGEIDGPEKMFVILLNNGRTNLLAVQPQYYALTCIRCGACLNACPVYKNIGGHTYGTTYNGPIGSLITPFLRGFEDYAHLSFATSLCGACSSVCPVRIDIANMLLKNKQYYTENFKTSWIERMLFKFSSKFLMNRNYMNMGNYRIKNRLIRISLKRSWGRHKAPLQLAEKSFNVMWKDQQRKNKK